MGTETKAADEVAGVRVPRQDVYAFPLHATIEGPTGVVSVTCAGMTLRDYFAAQMLSQVDPFWDVEPEEIPEAARRAYAMADAMLKAREAP